MSMYGSIGYTRRDKERERILKPSEKEQIATLETEKEKLLKQVEETFLEDEEEEKKILQALYLQIEELTDKICNIKYEKVK